jgi:hypothetical protein
MNELKQKFIEASQLERGMVLDAEKKADIPKGHITNWLRHSKMKSIDCWKDFVHDNFDRLKSETNQKNISHNQPQNSPAGDQSTITNDDEAPSVRAFTASITDILRRDLPVDIKEMVTKQFNTVLYQTSDYISQFGARIYQLVLLLFKNHSYNISSNNKI